jgi:hypothetical protein
MNGTFRNDGLIQRRAPRCRVQERILRNLATWEAVGSVPSRAAPAPREPPSAFETAVPRLFPVWGGGLAAAPLVGVGLFDTSNTTMLASAAAVGVVAFVSCFARWRCLMPVVVRGDGVRVWIRQTGEVRLMEQSPEETGRIRFLGLESWFVFSSTSGLAFLGRRVSLGRRT